MTEIPARRRAEEEAEARREELEQMADELLLEINDMIEAEEWDKGR